MPTNKKSDTDGAFTALIKSFPWKKLRRYEVTNLAFDLIALVVAGKYALSLPDPVYGVGLFSFVFAMSLLCVFWACRQ
jgi:hypothetical protein